MAPLDQDGAAAVAAIAAGCDLVLYCSDLERAEVARESLVRAAEDGQFARRLDAAAATVTQTAARWPAARPDAHGWTQACAKIRSAASLA